MWEFTKDISIYIFRKRRTTLVSLLFLGALVGVLCSFFSLVGLGVAAGILLIYSAYKYFDKYTTIKSVGLVQWAKRHKALLVGTLSVCGLLVASFFIWGLFGLAIASIATLGMYATVKFLQSHYRSFNKWRKNGKLLTKDYGSRQDTYHEKDNSSNGESSTVKSGSSRRYTSPPITPHPEKHEQGAESICEGYEDKTLPNSNGEHDDGSGLYPSNYGSYHNYNYSNNGYGQEPLPSSGGFVNIPQDPRYTTEQFGGIEQENHSNGSGRLQGELNHIITNVGNNHLLGAHDDHSLPPPPESLTSSPSSIKQPHASNTVTVNKGSVV